MDLIQVRMALEDLNWPYPGCYAHALNESFQRLRTAFVSVLCPHEA